MKLTENFTIEELTVTNTGLTNAIGLKELAALRLLAENVLQPLRDEYGKVIKVNSGYRSASVNRKVGGSTTSAHCKGEAADLSCADNAAIFRIIRTKLPFDQLIWEGGNDIQPAWVHVSYRATGNRRQVLKMRNGQYTIMP